MERQLDAEVKELLAGFAAEHRFLKLRGMGVRGPDGRRAIHLTRTALQCSEEDA